MKKLLFLFLFFGALEVQSQNTTGPYDSFMKEFYAKLDTVEWLCRYDEIAWRTTDSVLASSKEEQKLLGSEWFCFLDNNIWHAVYGKNVDNYKLVYHYLVDSNNNIVRTKENIDSSILNSYSRAIVTARYHLKNFPDSQKVTFNQYIRKNPDKSLSVWFLPAFTTNGIAVYGGEFYYLLDESGNNLLMKNEYSIGYRGYKPGSGKEIRLDYSMFEYPTLSAVFFVWYYKNYFGKIIIDSKKFSSSTIRDGNTFTWIHAAKE